MHDLLNGACAFAQQSAEISPSSPSAWLPDRGPLGHQCASYSLLDQLSDRIMNGGCLDEIDGMQAIDFVAVTLAGPSNQAVVVGSNPPPPIAGRILIHFKIHDTYLTRTGNQREGYSILVSKG